MEGLITWIEPIAQNLLASFFGVVIGIAFAQSVQRWWDQHRYGRWRVVVLQQGVKKVDRAISVGKAKEILQEPADLSVFLKGVVSPYGILNCDIINEGACRGLLIEDSVNRVFTVDLDKNPPRDSSTARPVL